MESISSSTSPSSIIIIIIMNPPVSSSLDSAKFAKVWKSLYDPAFAYCATDDCSPCCRTITPARNRSNDVVNAMLQNMAKLIFGANEKQKAIAICYGIGCLELCRKLVASAHVGYPRNSENNDTTTTTTTSHEQEAVWRSGLKVIKCSVIRCKVGRAKCRTSGIFDYMAALFETYVNSTDETDNPHVASLVEEAMTTLAAICLGDDLNALQAAIQLRPYVNQAANQYSSNDYPGMHQKIHYLLTLFDITVKQEHAALLENINQESTFFDKIAIAECTLWKGIAYQRLQQYDNALQEYTTALQTIQSALNGNTTTTTTKLLDTLTCSLYEKRATVQLELQLYDAALEDANILLDGGSTTPRALVLKSKALQGIMDNVRQAKKALP